MATEVVLPMLGITVEKGTIVEWKKKEGDFVEKGETIFIVETEKVATEVESPATGILAKILVPEGLEVPVLTVVAVITEQNEKLPAKYASMARVRAQAQVEAFDQQERDVAPSPGHRNEGSPGNGVKAVLVARKLAMEKGVDLDTIAGTGPEGVILVRDVEAALKKEDEPGVKVSPLARRIAEKEGIALEGISGTGIQGRIVKADIVREIEKTGNPDFGKVIPMSSMRKVIARRMTESASAAPHIYFFTEVRMDPLLSLRQDILPNFQKKYELRPSINDLLIKLVALNILEFPLLNATLKGEEVHILPEVNIGLAVALPDGLIVPALANADRLGLVEIIRQREDLVERAHKGTLKMDEIEKCTFTISSLAQFDITYFTAILNPPQSGILTVGRTREELFLRDKEVGVRKVATLGLSVDHRIVDGVVGADFLQNLKWKMEEPTFTFLQH